MKILIIILILATTAYFYFEKRQSHCENFQDVRNKGLELAKALVHAGTAKENNINASAIMSKIKKIELMKNDGFPDVQMACDAMSDLIDELE